MFADNTVLTSNGVLYHGSFNAFGHRCDLQLETSDQHVAEQLLVSVSSEVNRISDKYDNDLTENIITQINRGTSESIIVDAETAGLLDFSEVCYELSEGRFDVCCSAIQSDKKIPRLIKPKHWHQIRWDNPRLRLLQGMQLNVKAFTKAHACDRAISLACEISKVPMLLSIDRVHLSNKPRVSTGDWWLEHFKSTANNTATSMQFQQGAITTVYSKSRETGDSNYFDGRTNHPITENPAAITVAAATCTEANMLATLAMLYGEYAEQYLTTQQATFSIEPR